MVAIDLKANPPRAFPPQHMLDLRKSLPYLIPAIMYAVQNANTVLVLQYISPANFQFFSVLKIVFTALMFRLVFAKKFFDTQWIGVILLVCAMLTSSMDKYYGCETAQVR
jgi:drug/metabolite transporter (DMT)-like permease